MLELRGITAGYGDVTVLRDVDLTVPNGAVVALLGANGAGKTTLLRVASGLLRPTTGRVGLGVEDMTHRPAEEFVRRGICHVPEGRAIFRSLTVRDNLLLQAPGRSDSDVLAKAIETFPKLGQRLDQTAGTMSGGEQQMLALARSYTSAPTFVLLDEVSLGLAPNIVDDIFDFLRTLAGGGRALLLVEQYVVRALRLADYVYVLDQGRIAFAGEPGELDEDAVFRTYVGAPA